MTRKKAAPPREWQDVKGWFSDPDAAALQAILEKVPEQGLTAHVGIFHGRHLAAVADVLKGRQIRVLAIDTWQGTPGEQMESFDWEEVKSQFARTLADFGLENLVTIQELDSAEAARQICPASLDLVFLDADHSEEALRADILAWKGLVKSGGILCGHDHGSPEWPGVAKAVGALLPGARCDMGTVWWWEVADAADGEATAVR